ncbi:MAG: SUMF1/EgtB/PvdO family nonheme iron enzyme [Paracoccaceae bacterium]|nr:SUMF1/EgtB/PvdO family nonheme iron enzyme [Paracoccaceae bacterium]
MLNIWKSLTILRKIPLVVVTTVCCASLAIVAVWLVSENAQRSSVAGGDCGIPDHEIGGFVDVPGGGFIKGADAVYPEEGQPIRLHVSPFRIQKHEVTNDQFAAFVRATDYVTEAEHGQGSAQFVETETPADLTSWWRLNRGASWRSPEGDDADLRGLGKHPVVHVTLNDARAYAAWAGGRIPNEIEWEYAASLGLFDAGNPESGIEGPEGEPRANIWTGIFPVFNSERDGFAGTAPAGCYEPSLIGAYDMIGNVWEWTETPAGPGQPMFTIKGGSYLCGANFCRRYRSAARESMEYDFSTAHLGFRIVR